MSNVGPLRGVSPAASMTRMLNRELRSQVGTTSVREIGVRGQLESCQKATLGRIALITFSVFRFRSTDVCQTHVAQGRRKAADHEVDNGYHFGESPLNLKMKTANGPNYLIV